MSVLLVSTGTYAVWLWTSNVNKNLVMNTIDGLNDYIIYDDGDSKFVGNFQPVSKFCQSEYNTISFYKTGELETNLENFLANETFSNSISKASIFSTKPNSCKRAIC